MTTWSAQQWHSYLMSVSEAKERFIEDSFDSHQNIQRRHRLTASMGLGKSSIKLRGAEVGIEAIMLGCVTSIGGFLFGELNSDRMLRCQLLTIEQATIPVRFRVCCFSETSGAVSDNTKTLMVRGPSTPRFSL